MPARKIRRTDSVVPVPASMMDALSPIVKELHKVGQLLCKSLATPCEPINQQIKTIGAGQGKMLRPALVLLSGLACGGIRPEHLRLAAVIEMIHTATLLHDDVIDQAALRRNRPTANALHGNTAAVLMGDFLLSRAFEMAVELNIPLVQNVLTQTAGRICQGELLQNIRREDWSISQDEYLDMIEAKTAGLFSAACRLGAGIDGKYSDAADNFAEYGRCLGMAFQITDDILDITGDIQKVGKTLGTDAAQKKPTLPLIHYLKQQPRQRKQTFIKTLSGELKPAKLVQILNDSGSLDYARAAAGEFAQKAIQALESCTSCPAIESMKKIATAIEKRA